jgi:FlaA1/EpsC-like NDP-sugar epimerase
MENKQEHGNSYGKFFAMIATAMVVMFFFMYTNSYQIVDHFWYSETRFFMTLIMAGNMTIIMLLFMLNMYKKRGANIAIIGLGIILIFSGIGLVRSQVTVTGVDYMEGMIPHHSIAILTSEHAQIKDIRVRKLADEIIKAQRREIMEMEWLINDISENGVVETEEEKKNRPLPKFEGKLDEETRNLTE